MSVDRNHYYNGLNSWNTAKNHTVSQLNTESTSQYNVISLSYCKAYCARCLP